MNKAKEITDGNFEAEVIKSGLPVVVDFWAEWCGPCKTLGPIVDDLAGELDGQVVLGKLNVETSPNAASKYNVTSLPTLLFFKGGNIVGQHTGLLAKKPLKSKLDEIFK